MLGLLKRTSLRRGGPVGGRPPVEDVKETQPEQVSLTWQGATVSANTLL
jgi:hypothetical protein